jgi:hypothetical protein
LSPWWRRRQAPPKRQFLQEPQGVTSQKTPNFIVTVVKTSNLTKVKVYPPFSMSVKLGPWNWDNETECSVTSSSVHCGDTTSDAWKILQNSSRNIIRIIIWKRKSLLGCNTHGRSNAYKVLLRYMK